MFYGQDKAFASIGHAPDQVTSLALAVCWVVLSVTCMQLYKLEDLDYGQIEIISVFSLL